MKVRINSLFKKLIVAFYVVTVITSFCSMYIMSTKAKDDDTKLDGVLFIGDSRLGDRVKTKLEAAGANVKQVDGSDPSSGWVSTVENGTGYVSGNNKSIHIAMPVSDEVKAVAIDLGVNNTGSINSYKSLVDKVKTRYPGVPIYLMSIYYCGKNRPGGYADLNSAVDTYNKDLCNFASGDVKYIDVNSGLHDGNKLKDAYSSDGIHLTSSEGIDKFVSNIKSKISAGKSDDSDKYTIEEARHKVAQWGLDFYAKYPHLTRLNYSFESSAYLNRETVCKMSDEQFATYLGQSTPRLHVDCVGWCALAYRRALGLDLCQGGCWAVTPQNLVLEYAKQWFQLIPVTADSQLVEGDILIMPGLFINGKTRNHVALYCGNNTVVEMWRDDSNGLNQTTVSSRGGYPSTYGNCMYHYVARLVSYNGAYYEGFDLDSISGGYDAESVNLDSVQKKLKFSGLPRTITYAGSQAFPDIFEFLKGLLDWLVGLLFLGLKIFAMGITEICENIVNNLMHAVANTTLSVSN